LVERDLSGHSDPRRALHEAVATEAVAPFDLARGPLVRGSLLRLSQDDHVLLITMHHIVSDGWSMAVLLTELSTLYDAFHKGESHPLPPLEFQYVDYASCQRRSLEQPFAQQEIAYWKETLASAQKLDLPTDHVRPQ